jgi:hypothetical protein
MKNTFDLTLARNFAGAALLAVASIPTAALAHGFVGQRFFPATIATDDPFVADELSLPTISSVRTNADDQGPASTQRAVSIDFSKRISQNLGFSIGAARQHISFGGVHPAVTGNDNVELGLKYQLYKDEAAESLVSAGLVWEVGGTGSKSVGADSFSTYTPTLYFGKGFGAGPIEALRPVAVTGTVGVAIPSRASTTTTGVDPGSGLPVTDIERHPHVLQLGLSLQYSIPYLQSAIKDTGLGAPWNRMIPIVEIAAERPLDRVGMKQWTGTVNPGVLWVGRYVQLGLEAVIPINRASGRGVGFQAQLHFFLDDIFPKSLGQPLLASR